MLLHTEDEKDGLGKPPGYQLFVLITMSWITLHVGLQTGIREPGPSKGGTWGCSSCSRAAKQNLVGAWILPPWCPAHPTMTEMAVHSETGEAVPFFFALTFQLFTDTHNAFEELCHREMIKIQSSVKRWGIIFLSYFPRHLLSPFQNLVFPVQNDTDNEKMGFPHLFSYLN